MLGLFTVVAVASTLSQAQEWLSLTDKDGRTLVAAVVRVEGEQVTIKRKSDGKEFVLPLSRFSDGTQEDIRKMVETTPSSGAEPKDGGPADAGIPDSLPRSLYPRSLEKLLDGLAEISGCPKPDGIPDDHFSALKLLNEYRFLCHLEPDVEVDEEKSRQAAAAAQACEDAGEMSHALGSWTDKCNVDYGRHGLVDSMMRYIEDPAEKNRGHRGHRSWCLNPSMKETGFGLSEERGFSAMWAHDKSGKSARDPWSYPGKGLFPLSHLHGNAWTLYLLEDAPDRADLTVEVTRLKERPEKPFRWSQEVEGESLPVPFVSAYERWINFEPTEEPIAESGIYWVRITGGGVKEQYLVELFDLER